MKQYITEIRAGNVDAEWLSCIRDGMKHAKTLLFHIYTGHSDKNALSQVMRQLMEAFPDCHIVGTESGGEIREGLLMERGILLSAFLFESTAIRVDIIDDIAGNERNVGSEICRRLNQLVEEDLKAAEILLPGAFLNTLELYDELKRCDRSVVIFGGYAGNHDADLANAFVMADGVFYGNAVLVISYCGKDFFINAKKSAGWEKLGMPFRITKAKGNLLEEIDGIPAAAVYKRYLNIDVDDDFVENTNEFPIAAYVGGEELLRHTNQVNSDGSLLLAGSVTEGWEMYLTFGNTSGIIDEVNARLKELWEFQPQAILLYSCFVRKLFWEKFVNVELEPFEQIAPTAGFNTFGEVLRNMRTGEIMEYNITLLSIAMREGEAREAEGPAPQADDSGLSGQSSLIKRLAKLISSSTMEIQNAYQNLEKANAKLTYIAEHDSLTGLYNRGRTEELIEKLKERTRREGIVSTLLMFDIDHFKNVNDTCGHKAGDSVLKEICAILKSMLDEEKGEAAGRWGGEEFFVLLPGFDKEAGTEFAECFRKKVEEHSFKDVFRVTISIGVQTIDGSEELKRVYSDIDRALYIAKGTGRNRISVVNH